MSARPRSPRRPLQLVAWINLTYGAYVGMTSDRWFGLFIILDATIVYLIASRIPPDRV